MAALPEAGLPGIVDLKHLRYQDLEPLLEEETLRWRDLLDWDFRPSAELVRRFVRMQALHGYALVARQSVVGYCYFVFEENKGLIGDLFVRTGYNCVEAESQLMGAAVHAMQAAGQVDRVESQLMLAGMCGHPCLPLAASAASFQRNFMAAPMTVAAGLAPGAASSDVVISGWNEQAQDHAARLIARAYMGHIDGQINDQYRSVNGARRFLMNIVQYPGCGTFFQPASYFATDSRTGRVCGISLTSLVAFDYGHITQVCVDPEVRGAGVGYELVRRSMTALARAGCRGVSLTVTAANRHAVELYERMGFQTRRQFEAHVWDGLR
jgi:ribosomal protein S18 acetylase RimI-like enzyme